MKKLKKIFVVIFLILVVVVFIYWWKKIVFVRNIHKEDVELIAERLIEARDNMRVSKECKTYYVSSNGTSKDGTDIDNPMSLSEAHSKTFYGNERILFKSGDIFYGDVNFNIESNDNEKVYIGSYGEGEKPVISGGKILKNKDAWVKQEDGLYRLDLSNLSNFEGMVQNNYNIGFIMDDNGNIYGKREKSKELLKNDMDYYCNDNYLYIKSEENPTELLGDLTFSASQSLVKMTSNTILDGIVISCTGAHGIIKKSSELNNVCISNCIIENIGGSVQWGTDFTRYGNGIEFWNDASNTVVENCIIRNVYDTGLTIQGFSSSIGFENNIFQNNILINCSYDIEIVSYNQNDLNQKSKISNCVIKDNYSINQGRGWGNVYGVTNLIPASIIVLWQNFSIPDDAEIFCSNNRYYNFRNIYYTHIPDVIPPEKYKRIVKSSHNKIYMSADASYVSVGRDRYYDEKKLYEYSFETDSSIRKISNIEKKYIVNTDILNSNNYEQIIQYYQNLEVKFNYADVENEIINQYNEKKSRYIDNKEVVDSIEKIVKNLEDIRDEKFIMDKDEIEMFIKNNYEILNNELDKEGTELVKIVRDIDELANGYAKLFELNSVNSVYGIDGLNAKIDNTNVLLYYYKDKIELSDLEELVALAIEHYTEQSVIGYFQCENIIDIVDKIINTRIDEYNLNSVSIEYSTNSITNQDVVAKLVSISDGIEMPYGNTYTFTQNGVFVFKYIYKDEERELVATVDWIDKTCPEFIGINDRIDEMGYVTVNVVDENLESIVTEKDGQFIQCNNGDTLIEVGEYKITATDKAGNMTIAEFRIVDYIESNKEYYISSNGKGDGFSKNSPMNISDASKIRYYAGDKILFKAGEIYNLDLNWYMMGALDKNVTISSYGDGDMPVINGSIELVSNLNISDIRFTNSRESCLITNQMYNENIAIFGCVFDNIEDIAIYLNKQVSNININNCIFRNCGISGIALKNDDKSFIAKDILISDNMFIGMSNMIDISGDFKDETFENVQVCDNYFVNQSGNEASISYGSIVDTKFDVKVFNNFYYNFETGYKVDEDNIENLKNNLVSENNTWYALSDSKLLNDCIEFERLQNDYNLDNNSKFVDMNPESYQTDLIEVIASDSYDKNEIIAYILETIRMSSANKKVKDIDVETGAVTITSGYEEFISSKVGSSAELADKNSQEKLEDTTVAEVDIPLAGWKRIAFAIVAIAIVGVIVSGVKSSKYLVDLDEQIKKGKF